VKYCRDLKFKLIDIGGVGILGRSEVEALASLPCLKFLDVKGCAMTDEAVAALSRCMTLKHLGVSWSDGLNDVLRVIGVNLSSLDLLTEMAETWLGVAENCPNLVYLKLYGVELNYSTEVPLNRGLKKRLKMLASLKVNDVSYRLGTD
jgi:hypothetical protein